MITSHPTSSVERSSRSGFRCFFVSRSLPAVDVVGAGLSTFRRRADELFFFGDPEAFVDEALDSAASGLGEFSAAPPDDCAGGFRALGVSLRLVVAVVVVAVAISSSRDFFSVCESVPLGSACDSLPGLEDATEGSRWCMSGVVDDGAPSSGFCQWSAGGVVLSGGDDATAAGGGASLEEFTLNVTSGFLVRREALTSGGFESEEVCTSPPEYGSPSLSELAMTKRQGGLSVGPISVERGSPRESVRERTRTFFVVIGTRD